MSETTVPKPAGHFSLEELSATEAWHSLGSNVKRLLAVALESRNLTEAINKLHPTVDAETQKRLAVKLIEEPEVRHLIDLYALGVAAPMPLPVSDTNANVLTPTADATADKNTSMVN